MNTLKNKKVLVTGGAGFIGSHLVELIIKERPLSVVVVDNLSIGKETNLKESRKLFPLLKLYKKNAADFSVMRNIVKRHNIDVVFNLAAIPLPSSLIHPKADVDEMVSMVTTVCELQRLGHFKTLINFSSSEVYGTALRNPMGENHPLGAHTPYAAAKAAGDLIVLSYCRTFNLDSTILRPFNNYGPRQNEKNYAAVIPLTIKRILNNESPLIFGDGKQTRDFIYVSDTAKMAIKVFKNGKTRGKVINVGSGRAISILKLVTQISEILDYKGKVEFRDKRPGDVRKLIAGTKVAESLLDFKTEVSWKVGLTKTIAWYKDNL